VKRGARACFCGVLTHGEKVIDFEYFLFKKLENYFYFYLKSEEGLAITFDVPMTMAMA